MHYPLSRLPFDPCKQEPPDPERPLHRKGGLDPFSAPRWHFFLPGHAADNVGASPRGDTGSAWFPTRLMPAWAVALSTGDPPGGDRNIIPIRDPPEGDQDKGDQP